MDSSFNQIKVLDNDVAQSKQFIERQLPSLIHLQVCEGLNIVAGDFMNDLKKWEKKKLTEVYEYAKDAEGVEVNLRKFRDRITFFTGKLVE